MPRKLSAYKCSECKGIVLGKIDIAKRHEAIDFGQSLLRGFLYVPFIDNKKPKIEAYHLVTDQGEKTNSKGIVIAKPLNETIHHTYHHRILHVCVYGERLHAAEKLSSRNSKEIRRELREKKAKKPNLLSPEQVERFKRLFTVSDTQNWGITLDDLVFSLDD
jgi:hypothetical protein